MKIMRTRTFNRLLSEHRSKARSEGKRDAFAAFEFGDKVIMSPCVIRDCEITEKLVIVGDGAIVAHCKLIGVGEGPALQVT